MKLLKFAAAAAIVLLAASTASAEVQVTIHDGLVTIIAKDATVRQIIAEWARVGQAKVVNADRIPGGPTTIELTNVPESQALDTLLRSAAGYLAAPRAVVASNLSHFDRVVVMPTSNAPRGPVAAAPQPAFQPPPQFAQPVDEDVDDDRATPNVVMPPMPNPRGPVFNTFPQPQVVNPGAPVTPMPVQMPFPPSPDQQQQPPVTYPSMPTAPFGGVAVPGMVVPTPQQGQPGQIVQPGQPQPGQPRRPGGEQG